MPATSTFTHEEHRARLHLGTTTGHNRRRPVHVTMDHADTLDDAIAAIQTALAAEDYRHPVDRKLEASSIDLTRWGAHARGFVSYGNGPWSRPRLNANELVARSSMISDVPWWRDTSVLDQDRRPNGPITFAPYLDSTPEELRTPRAWRLPRGCMVFTMPTVLTSRLSAAYADLAGKINSNSVATFLELGAFPARTLRFAAYSQQVIDRGALGRQYPTQYRAIYCPLKWVRMAAPYWDGSQWITSLYDEFPAVTFPSLPLHIPYT